MDTNISFLIKVFLNSKGIDCSTAQEYGWGELKNGELVKAAFDSGSRVILTRDKLFIESENRTLKHLPDVSIVLLALPQLKESELKQLLIASWNHNNIFPVAGQLVLWPDNQR